MGYDAYGLPAEQYAIQTGQHPEKTTTENIGRYRSQMDKIGFSYDWNREVKTCDPFYYKWTQWTFIQLFKSWYNSVTDKAESIDILIQEFEKSGNREVDAACDEVDIFTAVEWKEMSEKQQQQILMNYRLAYLSETSVNWCPELGTVLANDEVKEGYSVRGGFPVERKLMRQWSLRITAYAQRLLDSLEKIDWSEALKEIQRNWIGRSDGAMMDFTVENDDQDIIKIFTTRADTIFGATYIVLAPEHELVEQVTTSENKAKVDDYITIAKNRSERERMAEVKTVSGVFTGSYAINPISNEKMPIWVADYVLYGYGTGAIMAVPAHDSRDYLFAKHFNLTITEVVSGGNISEESYDAKDGILINSGFINGMNVENANNAVIDKVEQMGIGNRKVNYRLRDAIFSRQRYWGEPFPVYYIDDMPYMFDESELPLELPEVDSYLPTSTGEPPLANAKEWKTKEGYPVETSTMPGFAGSSAYYLRYMDPWNDSEYFSKEANEYWRNVDLYIGGSEHATGHLIYARFWNKFLFDKGICCEDEPFKKLINQGMIQGRSNIAYMVKGKKEFVSYSLRKEYETIPVHVDINLVENDILDINAFKSWQPDYKDATFVLEDGKFICGYEIEKMSKSLHNVQNPDELIEKYGADTLRLYEMFLGPLEQSKPWDTHGIEGVFRFIKKLWRLYHDENNSFLVSDDEPTSDELKVLHKTIKKVQEDIERFSFNTVVSALMICVNELSDLKCNKRIILKDLAILVSSYAPHIAEELWQLLGEKECLSYTSFPELKEEYIAENTFTYPVSFNGKMRFKLELGIDLTIQDVEKAVLEAEDAQKWLEGKVVRKVIVVPKKIINIVI